MWRLNRWHIIIAKYSQGCFNLLFEDFHQLGPTGPSWSVSPHVRVCVCVSVCLCAPSSSPGSKRKTGRGARLVGRGGRLVGELGWSGRKTSRGARLVGEEDW